MTLINMIVFLKVQCFLLLLTAALTTQSDVDTCEACMEKPNFVWCNLENQKSYCYNKEDSESLGDNCLSKIDLSNEEEIIQDDDIFLNYGEQKVVEISPQQIHLKLRPNVPHNITFRVGQAKNIPMDLYFLMDLSWSMRDSRDNLAVLGEDIIKKMEKKTASLRIGFGSFVEKNAMPFSSPEEQFYCIANQTKCILPYSFKNERRLTQLSGEEFKETVKNSLLSGNIDDPEASLDALLQTIVCEDQIGWRNNSKKIVILATDRDFHYALDGRLAGLLKPNDGNCHLNSEGVYTEETSMDYPSISQINSLSTERNIAIIFAHIERYKDIYEALTDRISESYHSILTQDGSNIVDILEKSYEEMTSKIKISLEHEGKDLQGSVFELEDGGLAIQLFTDCSGNEPLENRYNCSKIPLGMPVEFKAQFTVKNVSTVVQFKDMSALNSGMTLSVSIEPNNQCYCESEEESSREPCNNQGWVHCGVCKCDQDYHGQFCQHNCIDSAGEEECIRPLSSQKCSDRGECVCGQCDCFESELGKISGDFCECADWTCPKNQETGEMCNGHGKCVCNNCECEEDWSGDECECPTHDKACESPFNNQICSGNGECNCGKCRCKIEGNKLYTGKFCENSPDSGTACKTMEGIIDNKFFKYDSSSDSTELESQVIIGEIEMEPELSDKITVCEFENSNGCIARFVINTTLEDAIRADLIVVDDVKEKCPTLARNLGIGAGGLILFVLLLFLLFYKCYIEISDRRQVAQFQRDIEKTRNAVNQMPNNMYRSPITKFENPTFRKSFS